MPLDPQTADSTAPSAPQWLHSTCPHDCPSTCALEVEVLSPERIGKVRGNRDNPYTGGVICAKVARYAERVHHPDRLLQPLIRRGEKGRGREAFAPIGWDEALDLVAERFLAAERRFGPETVWPYFYAGTMGHVQRDGIDRLRHVKRYSAPLVDDLHHPRRVGLARRGRRQGRRRCPRDRQERPGGGLGRQSGQHPGQRHAPHRDRPEDTRCQAGGDRSLSHRHRRAGRHAPCGAPGTDGALACAVMHVLFREGLADRDYLRKYTDAPRRARGACRDARPGLGGEDHRPCRWRRSWPSRGFTARPSAATSAATTVFRARGTARPTCTR